MVVRIRFGKGPKVAGKHRKNRQTGLAVAALAVAALLPPAAFVACILGLWSIAADLNWTGSFAIPSGIFSHWHVWLGAAVALQLCAHLLNRYGNSGGPAAASATSGASGRP